MPVSQLQDDLMNRQKHVLEERSIAEPVFFRLTQPGREQALEALLQYKPFIKVYDTLFSQLKELVKSRNPARKLDDAETEERVQQLLKTKGTDLYYYGVWVYYPWSERLVHLLDEEEFIELRTDRNRYKITLAERDLLATKKVGVIGLSVGQSVSLTLAMERGFGELRIADFDELEITNLNRLRSGVHNMGIAKTILVAREIAEIDPFLKVTCFHEGITEANLEAFLTDNGRLDVLIDECDGVDIKIQCRIAAKKLRIPVLMEASDRGTIDIERFDLEPDRPILHGFVEHLDISRVKELKTNEEKLPFILPIVGIDTMSVRLKASAVEVGQTIYTWPQLASAVTYGGGITADVCRRVLLDQLHQSGRYFIDIDELISDPPEKTSEAVAYNIPLLTKEAMQALAAKALAAAPPPGNNLVTDAAVFRQLVQAAAIAPSAGNNQPWKWFSDGQQLFLFHEKERAASFADYHHIASYVALGTALENLRLKASSLQLITHTTLFPLQGEDNPVAVIRLQQDAAVQQDELVQHLLTRCTNRNTGCSSEPVSAPVLQEMQEAAAAVEGASLRLLHSPEALQQMADIIGTSERLRIFIPQGHYDLFQRELRWTREEAEASRDGLDMRTLDLTASEAIGFRVIKDPRAVALLNNWNAGTALERMSRKAVLSSAAIGLVSMPGFTPASLIEAGRAVERVWLTAAKYGIAMQPMLAPLFHFARLTHAGGEGMPANVTAQFADLYKLFNQVFTAKENAKEPLFLFRLAFATEAGIKSLRLNLNDIYIH